MAVIMRSTRSSSFALSCIGRLLKPLLEINKCTVRLLSLPYRPSSIFYNNPNKVGLDFIPGSQFFVLVLTTHCLCSSKQKKDFQVARPIISYKFFIFAKLFRATAIVLDIISRATMPSSFGLQTFPAMMHQIVSFFQHLADDCQLECYNQDLVGFFTSIPVHRIMEAVDWMLRQFMVKHDIDPATYFFSVSLREKDSKLRVWKARLELQAAVCIKYSSGTFWPLLELLAIPAILQSWDVYLPNKEEQPLGTKFHLFLQTSVWLIWNKLGTLSMNPFLDKLLISFSVYDTWTIELFLLTTRLSTILLFKLFLHDDF